MKLFVTILIGGMNMKIGYARVSTTDQELQSQIDLLKKEGCDKIFTEKVSGASSHREELQKAISFLRNGDTLVVTKLDRLGRTVKQLIDLIAHFNEKEIGFVSLHDSINTSTPNGRFFFHIMASFAELERELIRERTKIGLDSARSRGKLGGRPALHKDDKKEIAYQMCMSKPYKPVAEIAKALNMSRSTIYRYLDKKKLV